MEFWAEVKSWVPTAGFLVTVGLLIYNFLSNQKLANNHLAHLAIDVKDVIKKVDNLDKKFDKIDKEVAVLKEKTKDL